MPPNILFIMTDQQRFDTIAALGHPHVQTPNLDRLAARGAACTNAYTVCPVCVPTRYTLMSGCEPSSTRWLTNWAPISSSPGLESGRNFTSRSTSLSRRTRPAAWEPKSSSRATGCRAHTARATDLRSARDKGAMTLGFHAATPARRLLELRETMLPQADAALVDQLLVNPYIAISKAATVMDVSQPTATKVLRKLEAAGMLKEITRRNWGKVYVAPGVLAAIEPPAR